MEAANTIAISSLSVYLILIPVMRTVASILLAVAVSRDCKARGGDRALFWSICTFLVPLAFGIIYLINSRAIQKSPINPDKKKAKSAIYLTVFAIIIYIITLALSAAAIVSGAASGIYILLNDDGESINSLLYDGYYDMNGIKYDDGESVVLYDKNGNSYHIEKSEDGFNFYPYVDEQGNEYSPTDCFISKDGYFYYDPNDELEESKDLFYYDKTFYDKDGNEYRAIGNYAFFDKDGKIVVNYNAYHSLVNEYAFE